MLKNIPEDWKTVLNEEFEKPYFLNLMAFMEKEYMEQTVFPNQEDVFAAFNACSFDNIKVVIIGQDPYHGPNQANGLCFSVKESIPNPPSLINIFKEIESDLGIPLPKNGDLTRWASQGVLLLNATLTVRAHEPGSHQKKGWERFTDAIIAKIATEKKEVIFLLWGGFAKKKIKLIDNKSQHILSSGHPSPLSANRGYWFGNKHFSQTNILLNKCGKEEIKW